MLRDELTNLVVSRLVRFLKKYRKNLSKQVLIRRVHRALDRLARKCLVKTEVIGSHRFAKLTEFGLKAIPDAVDLIRKAWMHETVIRETIEQLDKNAIYIPLRYRASEEWWFIAKKLLPKPPEK